MVQALRPDLEVGIAQAEAEGIQHGLRMPVEPAVAHVDALGVVVVLFAAEIGAAGVVLIVSGDGVGQPAGGALLPRQHVGDGVAALHAALPYDHQCRQLVAVALRPAQIHDAAHVQEHHHAAESAGHLAQEHALLVGEVVAALGQGVLPVLTGCPSDHHQGRIGLGGRPADESAVQGHLRMVHGPVAPPAVIRLVLAVMGPGLVG